MRADDCRETLPGPHNLAFYLCREAYFCDGTLTVGLDVFATTECFLLVQVWEQSHCAGDINFESVSVRIYFAEWEWKRGLCRRSKWLSLDKTVNSNCRDRANEG